MRTYVGIDLGTTNSVVCTYDGKETHVLKSPDQNDVTPSAIYVDRRGHRFIGRKAFEMAPGNDKNSATLFKRFMGTNRKYSLGEGGTEMTPEECSAELLRYLYHYLPEEVQRDPETCTVITVPAAFNQVKKEATLGAAKRAGIGKVRLMQEPVAAVMSILKKNEPERLFLVYDLGGGTFDVSLAEHAAGRVSLLAQGGREMCGGRDWDLRVFEGLVVPWLHERFDLPVNFEQRAEYARLRRVSLFAVEQAKIALSREESSLIQADEDMIHTQDQSGVEIYLDLELSRRDLDAIVKDTVEQTSAVAREVMKNAGVEPSDVGRIVFVGGPTAYQPLQDAVSEELKIPRGVQVNPMTAVAEGACIYAESIDWDQEMSGRKESFASCSAGNIKINYEARTAKEKGKIALVSEDGEERVARVFREDDGSEAASAVFREKAVLEVSLPDIGEYAFRVSVLRPAAGEESAERIVITRTLATVQAIPASHSVAVRTLKNLDGDTKAVYLVQVNDPLPKIGTVVFRAGQKLMAGSDGALVFTLWEGEIPEPIEENRYIGTCRIPGSALPDGVVQTGDEIICEYEMDESGALRLGVNIPSVGYSAPTANFYSSSEGEEDLSNGVWILKEANRLLQRIAEIQQQISDIRLFRAHRNLVRIRQTVQKSEDPETIQSAGSMLLDCRKDLAYVRRDHLKEMRRLDLDHVCRLFEIVRSKADPVDTAAFDNLKESAEIAIRTGSPDFETILKKMDRITGRTQWNVDSYVELHFYGLENTPGAFEDHKEQYEKLRKEGRKCIDIGDYGKLRTVVNQMYGIRKTRQPQVDSEQMLEDVNVIG